MGDLRTANFVRVGFIAEQFAVTFIRMFREKFPMTQSSLPTFQDIEALTAYLPRLYAENFSPVLSWEGGKQKDGTFTLPYPSYHPLVEEFFRMVSSVWLDYDYNPEQAYQMLRDDSLIKRASLAQIKTMLTFCVRGERFSDGHWGEMIEKGYIRRVLERLVELKAEQH
jgi:hypothetical protein